MNEVKEIYSEDVCIVLGTALIYHMFIEDGEKSVPSFLFDSVSQEYCRLHGKEFAENLVEKIALVAHGSDGEVFWMT